MADKSGFQMSRRGLLTAAAASLVLAACGRPAPATFDLSAPREGLRRGRGQAALIVPEPTAIFALDSERIVVRQANGELSYLGGAQWSDRLPRLLQARIIQTFENMGRAAVGRPADRLAGQRAVAGRYPPVRGERDIAQRADRTCRQAGVICHRPCEPRAGCSWPMCRSAPSTAPV